MFKVVKAVRSRNNIDLRLVLKCLSKLVCSVCFSYLAHSALGVFKQGCWLGLYRPVKWSNPALPLRHMDARSLSELSLYI